MKKLMIAAAAVALIGGAQAYSVYDFTASLKSTVGKYAAGKTKTTKTTYYLGADAAGKGATAMWYQDASLDTTDTDYFTPKADGAFKLTSKAKKDYEWLKENLVPLATTDKSGENEDTADYGYKSAGKWCETFTVVETETPDGVCYRVAGTIKVTGEFVDDCCATTSRGNDDFLNYFGASTFAKSSKVELWMADAKDFVAGLDELKVVDSTKNDREITALALAGQGSNGNIITGYTEGYDTDRGMTSVSGNAVGTADAPMCTTCCVVALPSICWECGEDYDDAAATEYADDTAVFGTFTIKYNASKTKQLVNPAN